MPDRTDGSDQQRACSATVRLSVSVPAELLGQARAAHPELRLSELLQQALRAAADCHHDELVCAVCGARVVRLDVAEAALDRFYVDVQTLVVDHARKGGTAEGVARKLKELGRRHHVRLADELPLPRLTRAEREAAKVRELPPPRRPAAPARGLGLADAGNEVG